MSTKAVNLKLEESKIMDIKDVAAAFQMTMTELFNNALDNYLEELKDDPYYRLMRNVAAADAEESAEILSAVEALTDDDLTITSKKKITL